MTDQNEFPRRAGQSAPPPAIGKPARSGLKFGSQMLIGAAIVVIGASILLENLDVISSSRDVLRFWPVFLVLFGLRDLYVARNGGRAMRGTLLVAFGTLLVLENLDIVQFSIIGLWPLFLILFGIQMVFRSMSTSKHADTAGAVDGSEFDDFALLGGVKRSISSPAFRGGSASAFMGGVDLDLRNSRMQGDRIVINVFAMMGGIVLRIPEDWAVVSNVTAILGGVDDKTRPLVEPVGTLVLEGLALMGGIEIKD
jgi:predicted membrane protein